MKKTVAASLLLLSLSVPAWAPAWAQTNFVFPTDPGTQAQPAQQSAPDSISLLQRYAPEEGQYPANAEAVQAFASPDSWIIPRYFELHREKQIRARASRTLMPRDLPKGLTEPPKKGDILPAFEHDYLPAPLVRDLPRLPQGIARVVVAHDVILLRLRNNEVIDVLGKAIR